MHTPTPQLSPQASLDTPELSPSDRTAWLERQLQDTQKLATLGQLSAGIAHEVKTPLQFVSDTLTFAQESAAALMVLVSSLRAVALLADPERSVALEAVLLRAQDARTTFFLDQFPEALGQAVDGVQQVTRLVLAMKEFSHPGDAFKDMTDLNNVIESAVLLTRGEWKHVASVVTDLDAALPRAETCAGQVRQVVINLIVNATHAIEDGRVSPDQQAKGTIRISTRHAGDHIDVSIEDSGCGIDPLIASRIFEPFFTTKAPGRGSGQGLALAHSVVAAHGGHIAVSSAVDRGTTFTISLPLRGTETRSLAA